MDQGSVVQSGTPEEIYNRPANGFVADFIGGAGLVPGRIGWRNGTHATIETSLGKIDAPVADELRTGESALLVVRPESLAKSSGCEFCAGEIVNAAFRGDRWLMDIAVGGIRLSCWSNEMPVIGCKTGLMLSPERAWITTP